MKTSSFSNVRAWGTAALAAMCLFAFSTTAYADRHRSHKHHKHHKHHHGKVIRGHHPHDRFIRSRYIAPRPSGFVITFGNGYAGRGYYYGPPNRPYYNRHPGVMFYNRRSLVPSRYW